MKLLYVTSNNEKIKAAKKVLEPFVKVEKVSLDLIEIQDTSLNVAIKKARDAYEIFQKPLFITDSSFCIKALNNFPGAYAKDVERLLGDKGILKLLEGEVNRDAYYLDILVYIDAYGIETFTSTMDGVIAEESLKGNYEPFDKIFIKNGYEYPVAYYQDNFTAYENKTYDLFLKFLKKRKVARGITIINNQVLLLHRRRKEKNKILDYYAIPGGGLEKGEKPEDACLREIEEETSIKVKIANFLEFETYEVGVCYYFKTDYLSGEIALGGEEKEHNSPDNFYEIALIDIDKIDKLTIPGKGLEMIKKVVSLSKNK